MSEERLHTHAQITVRVLSPVHIGDGHELLRDLDYVTTEQRTWVVNQDRLFDHILGDAEDFSDAMLGRPISELLAPQDYSNPELFRYVLAGTPVNRPIRSHIKTVEGRPYLPGSTLKGLLRTVFLWGAYHRRKQTPDLRKLGRSRSWAAQAIEREILGGNPNEDVFRAVHVTDSNSVDAKQLRVAPVSVYPTGKDGKVGVIIDTEALREETEFTARLSIEEYGFQESLTARLPKWGGLRRELDRLPKTGRALAGQRLNEEITYFQAKGGPKQVLSFYAQLVKLHEGLEKNQFLAQIGWGTGWNSKTLNDLLTGDPVRFAEIVRDYRLSRFSESFKPGYRFPASRHVFRWNDNPVRPMGWVLVTVD